MGINFKGMIKGTIFAILVTFVIILILALLSYFTGIDETIITTGVYASVIIGVILGTIAVSKAANSRAFVHAMLVCALYLIVLIGISLIVNNGIMFNTHFLAVIGGTFASGILGCIIGK